MADKTPIMSVEEYRALKKAGKLEQTLAAHLRLYGLPDPERLLPELIREVRDGWGVTCC